MDQPEVLHLHFHHRGLINTCVLHRAIRRRLPPLYGAVLPRDRRDYAHGRISKAASLPRPQIYSKKDIVLTGINMLVAEGIVVSVCLFCYYQFGSTNVGSLPGGQFDPHIKGFDAFVSFVFGILGTYFIHMVSRLIELIPFVGKGLQWVGKHSAVLYLFHPIFLDLTAIVVFQKRVVWGGGQAFFYVAVTVALLVAICLLMDWIKKKKNHSNGDPIEKNEAPSEN